MREGRHNLRLIQSHEFFNECASRSIVNTLDIVPDPSRRGKVPLQFALRGWMTKILQSSVHLAEQPADTLKQLLTVRTDPGEHRTGHECEQPYQTIRAVGCGNLGMKFSTQGRNNTWKMNFIGTLGEVLQSLALQIDKGT